MNFKPWYRREEYALMLEILEDGETLPLSFDEWEENALNELKVHGPNAVIPVFVGSEEFFSFCEEKKISPNTANLSAFAVSRGAATYSLGM